MKVALQFILFVLFGIQSYATLWQVGPARTYTYCSQVAPLVQDDDTVQIDFATYINDPQVQWSKSNLYIVGVGGPAAFAGGKYYRQ